jgi:hypothetical protein
MSTPYDPGRPEDRPPDQPGYPPAPPPQEQYPQAPPPQEQYPQAPPPPGGGYAGGPPGSYPYGGAPRTPLAPPREVMWASYLMFAQVALAVINAILNLADSEGFKDAIREAQPNLTPDEVDSAYTVGVVFTVVIGIIFAVLYLLLALQVRKGKNWARIVTFVLASLGLVFGLLGLAADAPALSRFFGVIGLLLDAAIIVLLLMKPSNDYFAAQRRPRY